MIVGIHKLYCVNIPVLVAETVGGQLVSTPGGSLLSDLSDTTTRVLSDLSETTMKNSKI